MYFAVLALFFSALAVEPLLKDPPRLGQPPNKGHTPLDPFPVAIGSFFISEKRTTSQLRKWPPGKCPLQRGFTAYREETFAKYHAYF